MPLADFFADGCDRGLDEVRRGPVARRAADLEDKIFDDLRAERRVMHLGVELHGPDAALRVGDAGQGVGADGDAVKAGGQLERLVAVAHPYLERWRQAGKERRRAVFDADFGVAIFALGAGAHLAAEVMHDEMQPVTDAQHRHAEFEQLGVGRGRVRIIDRRRAAREDEAERMERFDFSEGCGARQHDGEDILFANAPRYQLRVLRTEVEDDNCLGGHEFSVAGRERDVKPVLNDSENELSLS